MSDTTDNRLFFGDNLKFLRDLELFPNESVDLIYLDPPFNSAQDYNVLYKEVEGTPSSAQVLAFKDTWNWDTSAALSLHQLNSPDSKAPQPLISLINAFEAFLGHSSMFAYVVQMAIRLVEMHRILKQTGSLFLHCDPTASHYLKLVLDGVFDKRNFRNEIIWHYRRWTAASKRFQRMHDIILFYAKSNDSKINQIYVLPTAGQLKKHNRGWDRNTVPINRRRQPQLIIYDEDKVETAVKEGRINLSEFARVIKPKSEMTTAPDVWQIDYINSQAKERLGYPTQKPLELLLRIIKSASNPGDVILDPFCGCGTTIDAVESLNYENQNDPPRIWSGIDITHLAINLIKTRLATRFGLTRDSYSVFGEPTTLSEAYALATENRHQFQNWAIGKIYGWPWQQKKGRDRGIDGWRTFLHGTERSYKPCLIQVKSGRVGSAQIRDFKGTMEREKAEMGAFITLEPPTPDMRAEAAAAGFYHSEVMNRDYPRIQILAIEELLSDPDIFKIPPGGEYRPAPKFTPAEKPQTGMF